MSLLAVSDVVTGYGPTIVNRGVSLTLAEGEIVTILGPNGAGKSTLLKAIAGLIKPRAGSIAFDGVEVTGLAADVMARRGVVLVPEGRKIFVDMTVGENLRLGAYARRDEAAVEADFATMLAFFPILATKRRDRGGSLSGGEQQMLAIARGADGRAHVLIMLDEPSLGLMPVAAAGQGDQGDHSGYRRALRRLGAAGRAECQRGAAASPRAAISCRTAASSSPGRSPNCATCR